jgi:hypothetical protein
MNLTSRQRKLAYTACIVLLLIPIILLGMPAEPGSAGGLLARERARDGLSESDLGKVDPASSTMSLLLLGFRGIATSLLWMDAQEQQRNKDWAGLRATTESIILLQPHFLKVWHFQGWNLAYNVSAEWDAVADRWYWVKEGIKFFKKGRDRNEKYAELYWYIGDTTGKKIGRSDEWKQFRRFFRVDPDKERFQGNADNQINTGQGRNDNYLEAGYWFLEADETVFRYGHQEHIMAPYLFRSYPVRAQFDYAGTLQREGIFDEVCVEAWNTAFKNWTDSPQPPIKVAYGQMEFDCPIGKIKFEVPLEAWKVLQAQDADKPEVGQRVTHWIGRYQSTTNYLFWRTKSLAESKTQTADVHRLLYEGEEAFRQADFSRGLELFNEGMAKYEKVLEDFPSLRNEDETLEEALIALHFWRDLLELTETDMPDEYPLQEIWDENPQRREHAKDEYKRRRRAPR